MKIILEGPEGGGKTTLANLLSEELKLPVLHNKKPESQKAWFEALKTAHRLDGVIFDRHPAVSEWVYAPITDNRASYINHPLSTAYLLAGSIVVFCDSAHKRPRHNAELSTQITASYHGLFFYLAQHGIDYLFYDFEKTVLDGLLLKIYGGELCKLG